jgi:nickel transport protein
MKKMNKLVTALALAAGLAVTTASQAHGIWFAQRSTQLALLYGVGADDLDIVKRFSQVTNIAGFDADGKPVPTSLQIDGRLVLVNVENQPAIVAAVLDNGTWSKTPDGKWHKQGRDEVPTALLSEKNTKYAVHIRGTLTKPLASLPGQTLQIIPVGGKLPELLGQPMKIQVLYKGKPIAGAKVLHDWINDPDQKPMVTGVDGTVTIAVRNQGLNVLVAIFNSPSEQPGKYDHLEHLATLSFVLPHAPE